MTVKLFHTQKHFVKDVRYEEFTKNLEKVNAEVNIPLKMSVEL